MYGGGAGTKVTLVEVDAFADVVTGEIGVEAGTVPLEPLGAAAPVLLPAGKEYEYEVREFAGREALELLAEAVTGEAGDDDGPVESGTGKEP